MYQLRFLKPDDLYIENFAFSQIFSTDSLVINGLIQLWEPRTAPSPWLSSLLFDKRDMHSLHKERSPNFQFSSIQMVFRLVLVHPPTLLMWIKLCLWVYTAPNNPCVMLNVKFHFSLNADGCRQTPCDQELAQSRNRYFNFKSIKHTHTHTLSQSRFPNRLTVICAGLVNFFSFFFCEDGIDRPMKRPLTLVCIFLCVVLAAIYSKYCRYRLSCIPFVWHFLFIVTQTHTCTHTWCCAEQNNPAITPSRSVFGWGLHCDVLIVCVLGIWQARSTTILILLCGQANW